MLRLRKGVHKTMNNYWLEALMIIWRMFILAGTVYLIVEFNWSMWWLLLALMLAYSVQVSYEVIRK